MKIRLFLGIMAICLSNSIRSQVPPPPIAPTQQNLGNEIIHAIESKDLKLYSSLLSENITVYEDNNKVAEGKMKWLNIYGKKLISKGVIFKVYSGFSSPGRLLFTEYFNSVNSWGREIGGECCWSYDAVAYDIRDNKIIAIRRLRGGSVKLNESQ